MVLCYTICILLAAKWLKVYILWTTMGRGRDCVLGKFKTARALDIAQMNVMIYDSHEGPGLQ